MSNIRREKLTDVMKKVLLIVCLFYGGFSFTQNVEFSKKSFPDQKEKLNFALKAIRHGDELYDEAIYYYQDEDFSHFKNALPYYQKAQKFNPKNAELNFKIGMCILYTVHNERSLSYFEEAYKLNPDVDDKILYCLGRANHYNENWEKAIANYSAYESEVPLQNSIKSYEREEVLEDVKKKINECENGNEFSKRPVNVVIKNIGSPINTDILNME